MAKYFLNAVPDLRAQCAGVEVEVAQLLRIVGGRVPDPASVALLRLIMAPTLDWSFEHHSAQWPVARIAREWDRFRAETEAMFADPAAPRQRAA